MLPSSASRPNAGQRDQNNLELNPVKPLVPGWDQITSGCPRTHATPLSRRVAEVPVGDEARAPFPVGPPGTLGYAIE